MKKQEIFNGHNFCYTIGQILRSARSYMDRECKPYSLSRAEWLVVAILRYNQDLQVTQKDLREYLGVDGSHIAKILDRLEQKNIIVRSVSPSDRRNRIVKIKPGANEVVDNVYRISEALNQMLLSRLDEQEQHTLFDLLNKIKMG